MSNILILTSNPAHSHVVDTKTLVESLGHSVEVDTDFYVPSSSSYDLVMVLYPHKDDYEAVGPVVKQLYSEGELPLFLGSPQVGDSSSSAGYSYLYPASLLEESAILREGTARGIVTTLVNHPILDGIPPLTLINPYANPSSGDYHNLVHWGGEEPDYAGVMLGKMQDNYEEVQTGNFFAISRGELALDATPIAVKVVIADFVGPYLSEFSEAGADLMDRTLNWLLASEEVEEPEDLKPGIWWPRFGGGGGEGGGSGGGGFAAGNYFLTTPVLSDLDAVTGTFVLSQAEVHQALVVTADRSMRLQFYASEAQREADVGRLSNMDPFGDHGVLLDVVLTPEQLTRVLSPSAVLFERATYGPIPYRITNLSGAASSVTVTVTAKGLPGAAQGGTDVADYVVTTGSLTNHAAAQTAVSLGTSEIHYALALEVDRPARVRFYATAAQQAADLSRSAGTDPSGNHGVLLDVVFSSGDLERVLTPTALLMSLDDFGDIPATITNESGASSTVTVTLTAKGV